MRLRATPAIVVALLHAAVFAALAWWSWRKWSDPLIDFGRELYVPWQLTRGAVLYRDIASLFGPLSPYVNALWMRLFGVSLMTLAWCNMAILAATTAGIYALVRAASDRVAASAASLATLLLFGFAQYIFVGNFNFVTPYAHEATHGLAASVAMLVCLHRGLTTERARWFAATGLAFGLVTLTKPEIVVAAVAAIAAGYAAVVSIGVRHAGSLSRRMWAFAAAALLPPLGFLAYFLRLMPAADAIRAVGGAWSALSAPVAANPFYLAGSGMDAPLANAGRMLLTFAGFALFVVGGIWAAASKRRRLVFLAVAVLVVSRGTFPRALPLTAGSTLVLTWTMMRARHRDGDPLAVHLSALVMWSAFGLALLAKIALNARIFHYGFYLALPATTATIALVVRLIPDWLSARGLAARSAGFRQIALWMVAASAAPYLGLSQGWYAQKTVPVASGADRFFVEAGAERWQGPAVNAAIDVLEQSAASPNATIAVLPEGIMLNYLVRRRSPLPAVSAMPPELAAFGERRFVEALSTSPPDVVVIVRRDTAEYGVPPFGTDPRYGAEIMALIRARYRVVRSIADGAIDIYGPR